jgi:hypothetical protein
VPQLLPTSGARKFHYSPYRYHGDEARRVYVYQVFANRIHPHFRVTRQLRAVYQIYHLIPLIQNQKQS